MCKYSIWLPPTEIDVADAIALAAVPDTTDGAPVAVRSSGVAEDLAAGSYVGPSGCWLR
jgi:hypothetical protein